MTAPAKTGMSVQILQEVLARAVGIVDGAVGDKSTLPIASNLLLATDRGRLMVRATDLSVTITAWAGARIDIEGATTVPAKLFKDLLGTLPPAQMDLSLGDGTLHVECARTKGKVATMEAEDFPVPPSFPDTLFEIPARMLARVIEHTAFAAAAKTDRPILHGINFTAEGDSLVVAGADGYRLSVYTAPCTATGTFTLPRKAAMELRAICEKSTENVAVTLSANSRAIRFQLDDIDFVSQLLVDTYPNFRQLIPTEWTTRATVDADALKKAVRHASVYSREGGGAIHVWFETDGLRLSSDAQGMGDGDVRLDAEIEGAPLHLLLADGYFADAVAALDGKITFEATTSAAPVVFRRVDDDSFLHLVMPRFLEGGRK